MKFRASSVALLLALVAISCAQTPQGSPAAADQRQTPSQAAQASAFKGEVYRSEDGRVVVTMTSADELELSKNGINLICKYTRQANAIRAVETVLGTSQAVYYTIISAGIQDAEGRILYSQEALQVVREQQELARKRAEDQARALAEEQAKERQRLAAMLQESHSSKTVIFTSAEPGVLDIFPSRIFFVTKTVVSDVSFTFSGTDRVEDARWEGTPIAKKITKPFEESYWFGETAQPSLGPSYRYNLPNGLGFAIDVPFWRDPQHEQNPISFYIENEAALRAFSDALTRARDSWRAKFAEAIQDPRWR